VAEPGAATTLAAARPASETALALAGLAALLIGLGFGRFAYAALVPALIGEGWLTPHAAGHVAAANFAGYLAGALLSGTVARVGRLATVIRASLAASVVAFAASALDFGLVWLAVWRAVPGFCGALIMILVPMAILARVPPPRRPRVAGIVFTGVGAGIALSGTVVPLLTRLGVATAWLLIAVVAAGLAVACGRVWSTLSDPLPPPAPGAAPTPAHAMPHAGIGLLLAAYACDSAGFVPHSVYWVDFAARELGLGFGAAGAYWILYGFGAMAGPAVVGALAGRIGFGRAFIAVLLVKAGAVMVPVAATGAPALALSSIVVGALTPGTATLCAGWVAEIAGAGRQRAVWGWMTTAFAATQAVAASGSAVVYAHAGSYVVLFAVGAALLVVAAGLAEAARRMVAM
jgi:predicted MFS family arabinose efflux permease